MSDTGRPSAFLMLARASTLACPNCGQRGQFVSWFKLKTQCARCGLRLERGEEHDYWIGGMMFNIVLSEILAVVAVGGWILLSWPAVPWGAVRIVAILLMLAAPFLLFPMSRLVWLAFDLTFRPKHDSHYR